MPTSRRRLIGNFNVDGGSQKPNFLKETLKQTGIWRGVEGGGVQTKKPNGTFHFLSAPPLWKAFFGAVM